MRSGSVLAIGASNVLLTTRKEEQMIAQYPTAEQLHALLTGPPGAPVVMLNLLRFKPHADAPDEGLSGEDAYRRYVEKMVPYIQTKGARVLWTGRIDAQVIGSGADGFHMLALVEYPSREVFVAIATDPFVLEIGAHRSAGLEGQWLIAATAEQP
jgi:uncharacterized protein (DUF1330 family)